MNLQMPKSLTATVHVDFNYKKCRAGPPREVEIKILDRLMNRAADLEPAMQEMVDKFAAYMDRVYPEREGDGQDPS